MAKKGETKEEDQEGKDRESTGAGRMVFGRERKRTKHHPTFSSLSFSRLFCSLLLIFFLFFLLSIFLSKVVIKPKTNGWPRTRNPSVRRLWSQLWMERKIDRKNKKKEENRKTKGEGNGNQ